MFQRGRYREDNCDNELFQKKKKKSSPSSMKFCSRHRGYISVISLTPNLPLILLPSPFFLLPSAQYWTTNLN